MYAMQVMITEMLSQASALYAMLLKVFLGCRVWLGWDRDRVGIG